MEEEGVSVELAVPKPVNFSNSAVLQPKHDPKHKKKNNNDK